MSLVDCSFLKQWAPDTPILKMALKAKVRGIGTAVYNISEYVVLKLYLPGKGRTALLQQEYYVVDDFRANMLIEIDILGPVGAVIDLVNNTMSISTYDGIEIPITTEIKSQNQVVRAIYTAQRVVIPPKTKTIIAIQGSQRKGSRKSTFTENTLTLPKDRDLLFEPGKECLVSIYAHIIDHTLSSVQVYNDFNEPLVVSKRTRLGSVVEYEADGCFNVSAENANLAAATLLIKSSKKSWARRNITRLLAATAAFGAVINTASTSETTLINGITVYGELSVVNQINDVVNKFPSL